MESEKIPLIAIVGPTATGKTALGVEIAKQYNGEVVSADSMQIYQRLDIATAKPTSAQMQDVPHHLIGCIPLDRTFSVADYLELARPCIDDIHKRGKLPILVGGTGLYISSLLTNVNLPEMKSDPQLRESLYQYANKNGNEALHQRLKVCDPDAAATIHPNNLVRVVRALEVYLLTGKTFTEYKAQSHLSPSPYNALQIGLIFEDRTDLYARIDNRVDEMVQEGLVDEVYAVWQTSGLRTAGNAIGYKELIPYFEGNTNLKDCIAKIKQETRHYAKRQLTWFRKNDDIFWIILDKFDNKSKIFAKFQKIVQNDSQNTFFVL